MDERTKKKNNRYLLYLFTPLFWKSAITQTAQETHKVRSISARETDIRADIDLINYMSW